MNIRHGVVCAGPHTAVNHTGNELTPRVGHNPGGYMRKFDLRFKRKVVLGYLSGKEGCKIRAAKYDIANSLVRSRAAAYPAS
jgi:hypothetical protein